MWLDKMLRAVHSAEFFKNVIISTNFNADSLPLGEVSPVFDVVAERGYL
jgi:hypothetical protein